MAYEISVISFGDFILCACTSREKNEKWQNRRANIVNVKDDVKEIDTEMS